jgi:hypothetical protein
LPLSSNFPLLWRFADPAFCELPPETLAEFRELSSSESRTIWEHSVHPAFDHLMKIPASPSARYEKIPSDWNDAETTRTRLRTQLPIPMDSKIVVLWGPMTAVEVSWKTFTQYWDDFFYPSDDNNAVVSTSTGIVLLYIEDTFWKMA